MPLKRRFVTLQDRYVHTLAVSCCPTMDLIAILTLDHHLVVHRTTSWQKLVHIKPSDITFEITTLAWRPDGLQLAVGCDEGNVVIIAIESGDILPTRHSNFHHKHCITAMHWVQITTTRTLHQGSVDKQRCRKVWGKTVDDFGSFCNATSQSKLHFHDRASRFLSDYNESARLDTLLVTADERGVVALWWMGTVLLTCIDVSQHFSEEEFQILESLGYQRGHTGGFRVEQVNVAPDLSLIFIFLVFFSGDSSQVDNAIHEKEKSKLYRILTFDMTAIRHIHDDVALVARTIDCVSKLLYQVATYSRQMSTEWKNSTRAFELKMGLIGSLYEKYACEDLPQEDMLSVLVTGITSPALAQYFAQDIQEVSVHRMQKALCSGCNSLRMLAEGKLKHDLVAISFHLSEVRGHARWNAQKYATTLGITAGALDDLVQATQDALIEVEAFILSIHETVQDFVLFFQWMLERIRIPTNSNRSREGRSASANGGQDVSDPSGSKSLLNVRRLCDFLQRAIRAAQTFRQQQPHHNMYKVETTFGNLVSLQLSARPIPLNASPEHIGVGFLTHVKSIQDQWLVLLAAVAKALALTTRREETGCFAIGSASNAVKECHIHFRKPFSKMRSDEIAEQNDPSDDEGSFEDAIDWNSLKHYGCIADPQADCNTIVIGFRLQSGILLFLRTFQRVDLRRSKSHPQLIWDAAVISFSKGSSANATCQSFDFYGDGSSGKQERLAFVLDHALDNHVHEEWVYLQSYDNVEFLPVKNAVFLSETIVAPNATHTFTLDHTQGRAVASFSAPSPSTTNATSVISAASRGVLCVVLPPNRLVVFDAEDNEDDDSENDEDDVHDKACNDTDK